MQKAFFRFGAPCVFLSAWNLYVTGIMINFAVLKLLIIL